MIIRIVKLEFQEDKIKAFLQHFESVKWQVNQFPGCQGMKLLQDSKDPCIVLTYSQWEDEEALLIYRNSAFFQGLWSMIKPWFRVKAEAWSVNEYFSGF